MKSSKLTDLQITGPAKGPASLKKNLASEAGP